MNKKNKLLYLGVIFIGTALTGMGILSYRKHKKKILSFDEELFYDENNSLEEIKEDIQRNTDEITSLWEHIEVLSQNTGNIDKDKC